MTEKDVRSTEAERLQQRERSPAARSSARFVSLQPVVIYMFQAPEV